MAAENQKNLPMQPANDELTDDQLDGVSGGGFAGIDALIAVTQMKVDNANQDALEGAKK
jgi:hypothetical protein